MTRDISHRTSTLAAAAAVTCALGAGAMGTLLLPGFASAAVVRQARGADDPVGHVRQARGADDPVGHVRHGGHGRG